MIKGFRHKGLKIFYFSDDASKINSTHIRKIRLLLSNLDASTDIHNMNFPGSGLHRLKGELKDYWSVSINGNWRLIFEFKNGNAYNVDYIDYH